MPSKMHMPIRRFAFLVPMAVLGVAIAAAPRAALAQAVPEHAHLSLVSEQSAFQPGHPFWVGILFHLDPGWHVYWQDPGDSGTPPKIRWTVPPGFKAGDLQWPTPSRLGSGSVIDYGYQNDVLLMAAVTPAASASGNASIGADVHYVVCRDLCIPAKTQLSLAIPANGDHAGHFSASRNLFQTTRAQFPKPAPAAWRISATSSKDKFTLVVRGATAAQGVTFFPLEAGVIDNPSPQPVSPVPGGFALALKKSDLLTGPVKTLKGLLNVPSQGSFEISAPVAEK